MDAVRELEAAYGRSDRWTADGGYATPAAWLAKLLETIAPELRQPADAPAAARFAFADEVTVSGAIAEALRQPYTEDVVREFSRRLQKLERAEAEPVALLFKELRSALKERRGVRGRDVMMTLRAALTGRVEGPCLEIVVCLLGRRRTLERLKPWDVEGLDDAAGL
jgi:nondiscriminating glutamyl-tRNA synthetase